MKNTNNNYSWQGLLIISCLMLGSFLLLYLTGCFNISNYNELYNYVYEHGFEAIICIFFIIVGIYCFILFIRNGVMQSKIEILYLLKIEDDTCEFIDKKGKKYYYENLNYLTGNFYKTEKTHDNIKKVITISQEKFIIPKTKESYWLNFYSPMGNFENIFILPIVYVVSLPGLLSFLMSKGFEKIYGIIVMLIPMYIIIYDLIYKIKKKKNNNEEIDDSKLIKSYLIMINSIKIIVIIAVNIFMALLMINVTDTIGRIFISPFFLCGISFLGHTISDIMENQALKQFFKKSYIIIFLIYWFLVTGAYTLSAIKESTSMTLFSIPFWLAGLFVIYDSFIKKK